MPGALKQYWVTFTGSLLDKNGAYVSEEAQAFMKDVTRQLLEQRLAQCPAVLTYPRGKVVLTAVAESFSQGGALDSAAAAFMKAIAAAGGSSNFPEGSHRSWHIERLFEVGTAQEVVIAA